MQLWDCATGRLLAESSESVESAAFSPDGRRLATLGVSGDCVVWDIAQRTRIAQVCLDSYPDYRRWERVCFTSDGRLLVANWDGVEDECHVWDGTTGRKLEYTLVPAGDVLFRKGTVVGIDSRQTSSLSILDLAAGSCLATMPFAQGESPDGADYAAADQVLAYSLRDSNRVMLRHVASGRQNQIDSKDTSTISLSPDGRWIALGSYVSGPTPHGFLQSAIDWIRVLFTNQRGSVSTYIRIYDVSDTREMARLPGDLAYFSEDGKTLLVTALRPGSTSLNFGTNVAIYEWPLRGPIGLPLIAGAIAGTAAFVLTGGRFGLRWIAYPFAVPCRLTRMRRNVLA
jgi:WD40 repeat protein